MQRLISRQILAFLLVAGLAVQANAAKVVRLYNPWFSYGSVSVDKIHLVNYYPLTNFGPGSTTNIFHAASGPWVDFVLPNTIPAGDLNFTIVIDPGNIAPYNQSYGSNGIGGGDMNLGALLSTTDTVWITPNPLPNGKPNLLTSRPKEVTLMLWNPWGTDAGANAPSFQIEGSAWKAMDSAATDPGWYSGYSVGFGSLKALFRNYAGNVYFGSAGVTVLPIAMLLDSLFGKNDTIWLWTSPEPDGKPQASITHPHMKTVMLFNPWNGLTPVQRPHIVYGAQEISMSVDPSYCGWYRFQYIDRVPKATFKNATTGQILGAGGFGNSTAIDMTNGFATADTVWITAAANSGVPTVRNAYTGELGFCELTLLAATIRDFDLTHPAFEHFTGTGTKGMVQNTLGSDRTPVATIGPDLMGNSTIYDWFHDVPAVNATTCRDIPLTLDSPTGNYTYDNPFYFPIDEFKTLANGQPNPFNKEFLADDNKSHNFHFCLESHALFEYHRGQNFDFAGDDDVWVFINNTLAVDLGGVHGALSSSVNLDQLGLTEGGTYPFDFFFCERHTGQSHMKITTSLNLRNLASIQIVDTLIGKSLRTFDLYVSQTLGQGCNQSKQRQKTVGRFVLSGPSANPPISFTPGSYFGGIVVDPTMTHATIDTTIINGLAPGIYTFQVLPGAGSDTTGGRTVTFTVPLQAQPEFVSKPAYSGVVGSFMPFAVISRSSGKVNPNPVAFHLPAVTGIVFFRDSLGQSPVLPTDTLMTGASGVSRKVWLRGDVVGTYTIRTSLNGNDTVDTYPGITFTLRGLRYVDSLGNPILSGTAINQDVRTTVKIWIQATQGNNICLICNDTVLLSGSQGLVFHASATGPAVTSVQLTNGMTAVWVTGTTPVISGSLQSTLKDSSAQANWTPVNFRPPFLSWQDTSGKTLTKLDLEVAIPSKLVLKVKEALITCVTCDREVSLPSIPGITYSTTPTGNAVTSVTLSGGLATVWVTANNLASYNLIASSDSLWASATLPASTSPLKLRFVDSLGVDVDQISLEALSTGSVFLQAYGKNGQCTTCDESVSLSSSDPAVMLSASTQGPVVSSIRLVGGRARIWITSFVTIPNGTMVRAIADSLGASDSIRLIVTSRAPDSAFWTDQNGDGAADRLDVYFAHPWRANSSLAAWWPDDANPVDMQQATFTLSSDSLHGTWTFPVGLKALTTAGPTSRGTLAWDGRSVLPFAIQDRIPPVAISAEVRYGTTNDTLYITWSETIASGFQSWQELIRWMPSGGAWRSTSAPTILRDLNNGRLVLVYPSQDSLLPLPGDSVRFSPSGALKDLLGNIPGANSRAVVVRGTDRAPFQAIMLDADGDGRADRVVLRFRSALTVTDKFTFRWPGVNGLESRTAFYSQAKRDSGDRILTFDLAPWPYGKTSCPQTGCADLGTMYSAWGADTSRLSFPILDGVPPVLIDAELRYALTDAEPDTLRVNLSEPVTGSTDIGSDWVSSGQPSQNVSGTAVPWIGKLPGGILSNGGTTATFLVDSSWHLAKGDSIRLSAYPHGTVKDSSSNHPDSIAPWIPLRLGPHPVQLDIRPLVPVRKYDDWVIPANEPTFQIFVRSPGGDWGVLPSTGSGQIVPPLQDPSHYQGVVLKLNRAMIGSAYIYDRLGVHVTNLDLQPLADAVKSGLVTTDRRGNYEALLAWNGIAKLKAAASGVYLIRVVTHYEENGERIWTNQVFKVGWNNRMR